MVLYPCGSFLLSLLSLFSCIPSHFFNIKLKTTDEKLDIKNRYKSPLFYNEMLFMH
jgi:hypothetical protein